MPPTPRQKILGATVTVGLFIWVLCIMQVGFLAGTLVAVIVNLILAMFAILGIAVYTAYQKWSNKG